MEEKERLSFKEKKKIRMKKRKRNEAIVLAIAFLIILAIFYSVFKGIMGLVHSANEKRKAQEARIASISDVIVESDRLASGYDCDGAISLIKNWGEDYEDYPEFLSAISRYEALKETFVPFTDIHNVTHIFFHSLIADTSLAFDGEYTESGYNQYMTTVSEFKKILEELYNRGFVLVGLHDLAQIETDENGNSVMKKGELLLPLGKIPFIISQDDVSYYTYMQGDGFASRLVINDEGKIKCEYKDKNGNLTIGDYDLIPILDSFIEDHPDFSYRNAKAILALTGYDGILGYRTSPTGEGYSEEDVEKAKIIADKLKETGYCFASHSWGHLMYGDVSFERMSVDAKKWNDEVKSIVGDTDIMIYANGADIAGIEPYEGERYDLLRSYGFRYFCTVDSNQYWVQIGKDYLRQGRRNVDGYRMYHNPEKLEDLFETEKIWDEARPVPVQGF